MEPRCALEPPAPRYDLSMLCLSSAKTAEAGEELVVVCLDEAGHAKASQVAAATSRGSVSSDGPSESGGVSSVCARVSVVHVRELLALVRARASDETTALSLRTALLSVEAAARAALRAPTRRICSEALQGSSAGSAADGGRRIAASKTDGQSRTPSPRFAPESRRRDQLNGTARAHARSNGGILPLAHSLDQDLEKLVSAAPLKAATRFRTEFLRLSKEIHVLEQRTGSLAKRCEELAAAQAALPPLGMLRQRCREAEERYGLNMADAPAEKLRTAGRVSDAGHRARCNTQQGARIEQELAQLREERVQTRREARMSAAPPADAAGPIRVLQARHAELEGELERLKPEDIRAANLDLRGRLERLRPAKAALPTKVASKRADGRRSERKSAEEGPHVVEQAGGPSCCAAGFERIIE